MLDLLPEQAKGKEIAFFVILFLISALFLLYSGINFKSQFAAVYTPVLLLAGVFGSMAILRSVSHRNIPAGLIGLGNPSETYFGLPRPILGALVGLVLIVLLHSTKSFVWTEIPVAAIGDPNSAAQISLGSGILEETLSGGILLATFYFIFLQLGVAGGLAAFALILFFVIPFSQYLFVILAIAGLIFLMRGRFLEVSNTTALLAALGLNSAFFGVLHLQMSGFNWAYALQAAIFRILMDILVLLFGLSAAIMAHVVNNSIIYTNSISGGLLMGGIWGAFLIIYVMASRK